MSGSERKVILLFERQVIKAVEISLESGQLLLGKQHTAEWDKNVLASSIQQIRDYFDCDSFDIILGQDLASVLTLPVDSGADNPVDEAVVLAQETFGNTFASLGIDYTLLEIDLFEDNLIQLFVVQKRLLSLLGNTIEDLEMSVSSVEALGESLLRLLDDSSGASVILYGEEYLYASLVVEGHLMHAEMVEGEEDVYKQIKTLISSYEDRYNLDIEKIYMATKKLKKKKVTSTTKKKTEAVDLNPFAGNVLKNDEFSVGQLFEEDTEDESIKDLKIDDDKEEKSSIIEGNKVSAPKPPLNVVSKREEMESVATPENKSNAKLVAIIVTVVVVLVGMVVGGFFVYQNAMSDANEPPVVAEEVIPPVETDTNNEATSSSDATASGEVGANEDFDVSEFSVEVLNGSGVAGAAGGVADLLDAAGFEDIDTGNADSYDYDETVIQTIDNEDLYEAVLTALQDDYTVIQGDELDEDSDFDVVVIVGSN